MFRRLARLVRVLGGRPALERELDEELHDHLERERALLESRGMSPDEARRVARAAFGGVERIRDEVRDVRGLSTVDDLRRDARFAMRRLVRSPAYALVVIGLLALGSGAAATVYSAVDGVLLKPLPYGSTESLVTVWQTKPSVGVLQDDAAVATFNDWRDLATAFTDLAATNPWSVNLRGAASTETVEAWTVTEGFFALIGTAPLHGRWFRAEDFAAVQPEVGASEDTPRPSSSVILDHGFWMRRFGGDPRVIGQNVVLDEVSQTIVGVMPRGFALPEQTDLWMPNAWSEAQRRDRFATYLRVFGRLRPGVSLGTAQAEMDAIAGQLEVAWPRSNTGVGARLIPLRDHVLGSHRALLYVLLGAAGLLALVAVANVAALNITRLSRQRREVALRTALGARRRDVVRPIAIEALMLATVGGVAGLALASGGVRLLQVLGPRELPRLDEIGVDGRTVVVTLVLVAMCAALMVALGTHRVADARGGQSSGRTIVGSTSGLRMRRMPVGGQLALALVLVTGTSLLVRSFLLVLSNDKGYRTDHVLSFTSWVYDEHPTREAQLAFADRVLDRLSGLPGVRAVGITSALPLADAITGEEADIIVAGASVPEGQEPQARATVVSPSYFSVLGIPLTRGRLFTASDDGRGRPVLVVNEAFVRRFLRGADPIGQVVSVGLMGRATPREIVGVVGDTRHARLDAPPEATAFLPFHQRPLASMTFLLATSVEPASLARAAAGAMFELDPRVGVARMATMDTLVRAKLRTREFMVTLLSAFAVVAVLVAAVGVYGVMNQSVAEREREIGVRMALGAGRWVVLREFAVEAARLTAAGVATGIVLAVASARALTAFLYGVAPHDPLAVLAASLGVATLASVAALVPTWRATRVSPVDALREA